MAYSPVWILAPLLAILRPIACVLRPVYNFGYGGPCCLRRTPIKGRKWGRNGAACGQGWRLVARRIVEMGKHTLKDSKRYLRVYDDQWAKKFWHVKDGKPVVHKSILAAREYAVNHGYAGIRLRGALWEK